MKNADANDILRAEGADTLLQHSDKARLESIESATDDDSGASLQSSQLLEEPIALRVDLQPVAPFDHGLLPQTLRLFVQDVCERMQCPPDYVGVSIMTALGSVLGRKTAIRPQRTDDWTEHPNLHCKPSYRALSALWSKRTGRDDAGDLTRLF